jgi:hypothetical protein
LALGPPAFSFDPPGVVAEWLKAAVLKTAKGATPS